MCFFHFIDVSLHNENTDGDIGSAGSLNRLLRGMAVQRSQRRDEFITAELTNHLFQSGSFPFGLDLAAINIQRGRDHGIPAYTQWREPCGLSPIRDWFDLEKVVGFESASRIQQGYRSVDDVDLFVAGLAERPVIGGLVGPTFACIIAQQFSNLRKGDRFWYENNGFESSFTPAQLQSIRQVSLAQVICRTLGAGTLQPNVFLPHDILGNTRQPCGIGVLAPIDLLPWQERDPSLSKNDDRNPFLNPFLTKQESLDLLASNEELKPQQIPSAVLRPPFISVPDKLRPNRHPIDPVRIEPSIIISSADLRPNKMPKPSLFNFIPTQQSDAVRPNREPNINQIQSTETIPNTDHRPSREPNSTQRPSTNQTFELLSDIQPHVETSAASSIGVLHVVVDKNDFSANDNPSTSPTVVNNKVDFTTNQAASVHSTKRPVIPVRKFQNGTKKKPAVQRSTKAPSFTITNLTLASSKQDILKENEQDVTNQTKTERHKRDTSMDTGPKATSADKPKLKQMVILNADRKPSFDVEIKNNPSKPMLTDTRPLITKQNPNAVVVLDQTQPTLTTKLDFEHSTIKQYMYDRPPTSPRPFRPNIQNEFDPPNEQYAISYDVTVTTTEHYSYYRPVEQPSDYNINTNLPYSYNRPDFSITTSKNPFVSTPFSYNPTNQKLTSTFNDGKLTKPFHKRLALDTDRNVRLKQKPTKLDFGEEINVSPFSNVGLKPAYTNAHTQTYYLNQDDGDDDLHRPTTKKQNDRLQDNIDSTKPGQVYFVADADTKPTPTPITSSTLQNFYPSVVLQKFVSSISKYFGYGKQGTVLTRHEPYDAVEEANLRELTRVIQDLHKNQTNNGTINTDLNYKLDKTDDRLLTILDKLEQTPIDDSLAIKRLPDYLEHFPNGSIQFDLDGYLRPEYMNIERITTNQTKNFTFSKTEIKYENKKQPTDTDERDPCDLPVSPPQPIAPLVIKDIPLFYKTTEAVPKANVDREFHPVFIQSRSRGPDPVSFVSMQLLTRPER